MTRRHQAYYDALSFKHQLSSVWAETRRAKSLLEELQEHPDYAAFRETTEYASLKSFLDPLVTDLEKSMRKAQFAKLHVGAYMSLTFGEEDEDD